ncbi:protein OSCP1-like isoform X1 [Homarus americanus]|uniref:protein OSCP1-like isoform X1 n=1 Tax=Homarus americanus TaxID=6706 RepID=UPI001C485C6D|nr:protein OSCP1-like isoform X1 [Homarus americanus]
MVTVALLKSFGANKMSLRALPLQFLNLGGEMMYIIDQRLRAQNILPERAAKVRNDIIGIMLNRRFVEELFKPQELYNRRSLRTVFDKLAHASIMRLNAPSMDKLYDLMVMAVKQQVLMCPQPGDLLLITLNHLDALRIFATVPTVLAQVESTLNLFRQTFCSMSVGELAEVRRALLGFVQDLRIRVSIFLKEKQQTPTGTFILPTHGPVPHGSEVPGIIRVFEGKGEVVSVVRFPSGGQYTTALPYGSLAPTGPRGTSLGTNMYESQTNDERPTRVDDNAAFSDPTLSCSYHHTALPSPACSDDGSLSCPVNGRARDELNLLAQLIGSASTTKKEFRLNLFLTDENNSCVNDNEILVSDIITIEGGERDGRPELGKILGELTLQDDDSMSDKGQDLLDLMDSV